MLNDRIPGWLDMRPAERDAVLKVWDGESNLTYVDVLRILDDAGLESDDDNPFGEISNE